MFYVMSGLTYKAKPNWLRGNIVNIFPREAMVDWFEHPIVKRAMLDIDNIVSSNGMTFTKRDGSVIPCNWFSHGLKQFIMMTQRNDLVCDSYYFGENVYKYFYEWSIETGEDVYVMLYSTDFVVMPECKGIFVNTGECFNDAFELGKIMSKGFNVLYSDSNDGIVTCREVKSLSDRVFTGKEWTIQIPFPKNLD